MGGGGGAPPPPINTGREKEEEDGKKSWKFECGPKNINVENGITMLLSEVVVIRCIELILSSSRSRPQSDRRCSRLLFGYSTVWYFFNYLWWRVLNCLYCGLYQIWTTPPPWGFFESPLPIHGNHWWFVNGIRGSGGGGRNSGGGEKRKEGGEVIYLVF